MIYVSEALLYLCFCVLVGSSIVKLLPQEKNPAIHVPAWLIKACVLAVVILSLFPLIREVQLFAEFLKWDFSKMFIEFLKSMKIGKGWLYTFIICMLLMGLLIYQDIQKQSRIFNYAAAALVLILVLSFGWSSHSAYIYQSKGFIAQTTHFLSITVWAGLLFMAGWFAGKDGKWALFLRWFTPLSIICIVLALGSGLFLMQFLAPETYNSLMLTYGQALLIKHLFIVPLLAIAFINGFLIPAKLRQQPDFDPRSWWRVESVLVIVILSTTGFMSQQAPPHTVAETLKSEPTSTLFTSLFQGDLRSEMSLTLGMPLISILLALAAIAFIAYIVLAFLRKWPLFSTLIASVCFVLLAYLSIMLALK